MKTRPSSLVVDVLGRSRTVMSQAATEDPCATLVSLAFRSPMSAPMVPSASLLAPLGPKKATL